MKFNFFSDSGLVFSDGLSNGRFGRAVNDAGEDDAAFVQSQMSKSIGMFHDGYQPFRRLRDRISVRLNAT